MHRKQQGAATILVLLGAVLIAGPGEAGQPNQASGEREARNENGVSDSNEGKLTVAVLAFSASDPANPDLGEQLAAALNAVLSGKPGIELVDRNALDRTLQEQELNLSGLVDNDRAIKIGKLVGARIMVMGRAFALGGQRFITAKLIGTETTLVEGVMVKSSEKKPDQGLDVLTMRLARKVARRMDEAGANLVAGQDGENDPAAALSEKLKGRDRPVVAVVITEEHYASPARRRRSRPADPAVETEVKKLLNRAGFTVQDVKPNALTDFANGWTAKNVDSWPRGLAGVEVLIAGEAFSEFAAQIGGLVSASARAEVNLIRRRDGRVVYAERVTSRAADLSEQLAGKKALQKAGRRIGIEILRHFDRTLPGVEGDRGGDEPPAGAAGNGRNAQSDGG